MKERLKLYLLPGLGADHRIFQRMDLSPFSVHYLDWPVMKEGSTLLDFARSLASKVEADRPHVLVGMSMGGMVAQAMAAITRPLRTVILSSWKGPQEMPPAIKLIRNTHPERVLTEEFLERALPVMRWQMGAEDGPAADLLNELVAVHTIEQLKIQVNACMEWEGPGHPVPDLVHLHGNRDRLMPVRYVSEPIVIHGGGHFMVFTHAEAVSAAIRAQLGDG